MRTQQMNDLEQQVIDHQTALFEEALSQFLDANAFAEQSRYNYETYVCSSFDRSTILGTLEYNGCMTAAYAAYATATTAAAAATAYGIAYGAIETVVAAFEAGQLLGIQGAYYTSLDSAEWVYIECAADVPEEC